MNHEYDADVIVVGSGAVGSNVAYRLAKQGKSVILLEAGPNLPRWKILENFRNSGRHYDRNDSYPDNPWAHTSYHEGYLQNTGSFPMLPGMLKNVGGTTWHWGGATWRFIPNDFKTQYLYGVGRDWPISYDDLEPYYCEAEYELGVAGSDTEDQSGNHLGQAFPSRSRPYPITPEDDVPQTKLAKERLIPEGISVIHEPTVRIHQTYDGRPGCKGNNNCDHVCPIGTLYNGSIHADKAVRAGAKLISEAVVYKINKGEKEKIESIQYLTPNGEDHKLSAKYFILSAHSFETPKLMLMNDIGNSSDMVGRNLMEHVGIGCYFLADKDVWTGRGPVQQGTINQWRDGAFRSQYSGTKHSLANNNPGIGIAEQFLQQGLMGKELDEKIIDWSKRYVSFYSFLEQLPSPSNRVQPNPNWKNSIGLPGILVHYDVSDYTKRGAVQGKLQYEKMCSLMGGEMQGYHQFNVEDNHDHLMGTMIMGEDPKDSVVNHEGRSFDHDNLFIASVGVIPAAGVVNPTLSAVALGIRSADIIAKEI